MRSLMRCSRWRNNGCSRPPQGESYFESGSSTGPTARRRPGSESCARLQALLERINLLETLRQRPHLFLRSLDPSALSAAVFALLHLPQTLKPAGTPKKLMSATLTTAKRAPATAGTEPSSPKHSTACARFVRA